MTASTAKIGVEEYVENFLAENAALRRKLQSKAEALLILSKELDQCRTERDQFKLMAEQLQDRYSSLKRKSIDLGLSRNSLYGDCSDRYGSGSTLLEVLQETKEKNKAMKIEIEDLRQKLRDTQGDIKVLRRLNQQRTCSASGESKNFPSHQREELVQQMETMHIKCSQLEVDLQSVLDEKEELVTQRDAYKGKVHRLNHELNSLLKNDTKKILDVDALVMENRYLHDRLQQIDEEKAMANQALSKYKNMLEKKRSKGTVKFGANSSAGMVMTHKQVQQLLDHGTAEQLPNTAAALADMRSLCTALLEAVNDKSVALIHHKKTNRTLARRVSELEQRLSDIGGGPDALSPSQLLLDGYTNSQVDRDVNRIFADEEDESDSEGVTVYSSQSHYLEQHHQQVSNPKSEERDLCTGSEADSSINIAYQEVFCEEKKDKLMEHSDAVTRCSTLSKSAKTGDSEISGSGNDALPLELQKLVQKALEEIKQEEMNRH